MRKEKRNIKKLIEPGLEIVGNTAGSTVGAIAGVAIVGPPGIFIGSAGGAMLNVVFSKIGKEIQQRYPRVNER